MKKALILICLIFAYCHGLLGQNKKISILSKIGVSYNSVYDPSHWEFLFSPYLIGVELMKPISKKSAVSADLSYIRKGPHYIGDNKRFSSRDYIFDFILLSGNLSYLIIEEFQLNSIIGIYSGIVFNSKERFSNSIKYFDMNNKIVDIGINLSLRKYFNIGGINFFIEPKFQLGLITVSNSKQLSYQLISGIQI